MPRITRLRLVDIGHKDARMEDLSLPLERAGQPTDTIIWLRNGGGKSSILNLFYSVVRPNLRDFLGAKADQGKRHLSDYVLADDHGLVGIEWVLDDAAQTRYLTLAFYERKPGGSATDIPLRHFFAGRVITDTPELTLEGLPIHGVNERGERVRRTLAGFRHEWTDLARRHPAAGLIETDNQTQWEMALADAGIDPGLFRFQLEMNRREGGADDLFRFESTEEFVDFFLDMVVDPGEGEQIARNLGEHRDTLRKLTTEYLPGRDFAVAMLEALRPLVELGMERKEAFRQGGQHRHHLHNLEEYLQSRIETLRAEAVASRRDAEEAEHRARELSDRVRALRGESLGIKRYLAEAELVAARAAHQHAQDEHQESLRQSQVWAAAVPLAEVRRHEAEAKRLLAVLAERQAEHRPLLDDLIAAALSYDAVLQHRIQAVRADAEVARKVEEAEREAAREHLGLAEVAAREALASAKEAEGVEEKIEEEVRERRSLIDRNILDTGESIDEAAYRWAQIGLEAQREAERLEQGRQSTLQRTRDKQAEHTTARAEVTRIEERLGHLDRAVEEASTEREELEIDPHLRRAMEAESIDVDRLDAPSVLEVLRIRATAANDRVRDLHIALAEHDRALAYLERHKLLPPAPDVERVLAALNGELPSAMSGWRYIASKMPDQAEKMVRTRPWLAGGVIVRDDELDHAQEVLCSTVLHLEGPVVVAPQSAVHVEGSDLPSGIIVGPSSAALYSEESARHERVRREQLQESQQVDRERHRQEEEAHRRLIGRIEAFRRRYPPGWFAERAAERERLIEDRSEWNARVEALQREVDTLQADAERLRSDADAARDRAAQADWHREMVQEHVRRWGADPSVRGRRLESLRKSIREAKVREDGHREDACAAEERAKVANRRLIELKGGVTPLERDRNSIKYLEGREPLAPRPGSLEDARWEYQLLLDRYNDVVREGELRGELKTRQDEAQRARRSFRAALRNLSQEEVEAALDTLDDPDLVATRRAEAESEEKAALGRISQRSDVLRRAKEHADRIARECEEHGDVPFITNVPDPGAAESRAIKLLEEADEAEARCKEARTIAEQGRHRAADRDALADTLGAHRGRVQDLVEGYREMLSGSGEDEPSSEPWSAPEDGAVGVEVERLSACHRELQEEHRQLDRRRIRLVSRAKDVLDQSRFANLRGQYIQKLRRYSDEDFELKAELDSQDLESRKQMIEDEITAVEPNKQALVVQLLEVASKSLRMLESAQRRSRLPDDIPTLGGLDFLKVTTSAPEDIAARKERISRLIDDITSSDRELPDGRSLVHQSVRRLGSPIKVRVLKPKLSGEPEWLGIVPMGKESGGERLTSAVMLYCTMARMRAVTRGQSTSPLLLDNPIGAASWEPFLELQRRVAEESGVQLIYFTGVDALGAIRAMSHVVRLRNSKRDRWSGMALVEQDEESIEAIRVAFTEAAAGAATSEAELETMEREALIPSGNG